MAGLADADSWATDAHKWLNVPYDSGLAFVRDTDALRAAMAITPLDQAIAGMRPPQFLSKSVTATLVAGVGLLGTIRRRPRRS